MRFTGTNRSDCKHLAKCRNKSYYWCLYYGSSCRVCEFNINKKRIKTLGVNNGISKKSD